MNTEDWDNILTLLTMVILVDDRVYKEEVDTFVTAVYELNNLISPDIFITESMAFEWFKSNRDRVKNLLVGRNMEKNIKSVIVRLKKIRHKQQIIDSMTKIAKSDANYHKKEHFVIKQAAYSWRLDYPS